MLFDFVKRLTLQEAPKFINVEYLKVLLTGMCSLHALESDDVCSNDSAIIDVSCVGIRFGWDVVTYTTTPVMQKDTTGKKT